MTHLSKHLEEIEKEDLNPYSGRLFAYFYETGDEELKKIAKEALLKFYDKNILDFTVFRSAIHFEREVVAFCKKLVNADENVTGTFTFGGTESIFLAVKSARDYYKAKFGSDEVPEMIVPVTIHPSFYKAAHYLGVKVRRTGITEDKKADVKALKEAINDKTALIALSAPNWPYGTVDPVKEVAEIAQDKKVLLHVDACLGGFILPFFEKAGEKVAPFDFRIDGVTSISMDAHKYGYTSKGASIILFRDPELKKHSMYVDVSSPGYIFVNAAVLSSRSVGPLASAYTVIKYLGEEGYLSLAKKVLSARQKIYGGLKKLGFESIAPVESSVITMYSKNTDLLSFVSAMRGRGWHFHLQKGLKEFNIPPNIHLTLSPVHDDVAEEFLQDASKAVNERASVDLEGLIEMVQKGSFTEILRDFEEGKIDSSIVPILLDSLPEEVASEIVKEIVIGWYR
jgi:glutamate/tyrosine decarboxylase-like PLP-dependent enzyme